MIVATHVVLLAAGVAVLAYIAWRRNPRTMLMVLAGVALAVVIEYRNDRFYPYPPLHYAAPRLWVLPDSNIPLSMMAYVGLLLTACAEFGIRFRRWLRVKEWPWPVAWPAGALGQLLVSVGLAAFFEFGFVWAGVITWRLADPSRGPWLGTATAAALCLVTYAAAAVTAGAVNLVRRRFQR